MNRYQTLNEHGLLVKSTVRIAAYCRVSTDKEDQANSFESQQRYFKEYIKRMEGWELYEIFADEGITGTNTKKRQAFNRMISCAMHGHFDLILTKEISRFARNTLDSIFYTRELKKHGVGVFFLNDNINTLDADAELRLTIMSSIAQEESRKISERVKWGQKRRMEQGVVFGRDMLGYDVRNGKIYINEEGANIVRLIFQKYVEESKGTHVIARELREAGYKTLTGNVKWTNTAILKILHNEKYCGDLVQKKTFTPDYLSHDKKYNKGQEDFVIIKNHHEPIISREKFETASKILDQRALSQQGKEKYSNRYAFSGKIKCGACDQNYVARYKMRKDGSQYKAWRCTEAARYGSPHIDKAGNHVGCISKSIRNEDAVYIMNLVSRSLQMKRNRIIKNMVDVVNSVVSYDMTGTDIDKLKERIDKISERKSLLVELYLNKDITRDEFSAARIKCDDEIALMVQMIDKKDTIIKEQSDMLLNISCAINEIAEGMTYEDEFYKNLLDRMIVNDKDHIDVYLNLLSHKWSYAAVNGNS